MEASYQRMVPLTLLEAAMVTVPVPQRDPSTAVGAAAFGKTVATTGTRELVHTGDAVTIST